jgi:hypothetical protein
MDSTALETAGLSAGAITIILTLYRVLGYLKGKRLVSECCKRKVSIGFDVREMKEVPSEATIVDMAKMNPVVNPLEKKSVSVV